MTELQALGFKGNLIRSFMNDGKAYFFGEDVANVLGYDDPNQAIADLVDELDQKFSVEYGCIVINMSGAYALALPLHHTEDFERWIVNEGVPQTEHPELQPEFIKNLGKILRSTDHIEKEITKLKQQTDRNTKAIHQLRKKYGLE